MDELIKILEAQVNDAQYKTDRAKYEHEHNGLAYHVVRHTQGHLCGATNALAAAKQSEYRKFCSYFISDMQVNN